MTHIIWNNKNLKSVFNEFDTEKKGKMTLSSFKKMLTSVNKEITDDEIKAAFDLID
jgi:Ca2+-binding EF-hand superfamily protein